MATEKTDMSMEQRELDEKYMKEAIRQAKKRTDWTRHPLAA